MSRRQIIIQTMAGIWAHACLLIDIWSMKLFVWMLGRNGELLDSHLFFFDRYSDLSDYHREKGRAAKAAMLAAIAEAYYQAAPDDDEPPETAAMAMPVPRPQIKTNAVSTMRITKPPGERQSNIRIGRAGTWAELAPLLERRVSILLAWANDDSLWEDSIAPNDERSS
jgi:hypothetical protein